mgnify:CR=1 FL=1
MKVLDADGNEIELKDEDEDTYQPAPGRLLPGRRGLRLPEGRRLRRCRRLHLQGSERRRCLTVELEETGSDEELLSDEDYE